MISIFNSKLALLIRYKNTEKICGTKKYRWRAIGRSRTLEIQENSHIFANIPRVSNKIRYYLKVSGD